MEKLTADNYGDWKFQMQMLLIGKDLWEIVEGTEVLPDDANQHQQMIFSKALEQSPVPDMPVSK